MRDKLSQATIESPLDKVSQVSPHASIQRVGMRQGVFEFESKDDTVEFGLRLGFGHSVDEGQIKSYIHLEMRLESLEDETECMRLLAAFEVIYGLEEGVELSEDSIEAFAKINGTFNVWPYWREYVAQCASRMNLTLEPVPLITIQGVLNLCDFGDDSDEGGNGGKEEIEE